MLTLLVFLFPRWAFSVMASEEAVVVQIEFDDEGRISCSVCVWQICCFRDFYGFMIVRRGCDDFVFVFGDVSGEMRCVWLVYARST